MKRWSIWILFFAAAGIMGYVASKATRQQRQTPAETLAWVQERLGSGRLERDLALNHLDLALAGALAQGDAPLSGRIRLARGRILVEIASWDLARTDVAAALERGGFEGAERREVESLLVRIETSAGRIDRALELADSAVRRDPGDGAALARAGGLRALAADRSLQGARAILDAVLVPEESARAAALLERAASLDPADPARVAAGHEMRALFDFADEARAEEVLRIGDAACLERERARAELSASLGLAFDGEALGRLLELFVRAGHAREATDLGLAALTRCRTRGDVAGLLALVRAQDQLERRSLAADVAESLLEVPGPHHPDLLLELCGVFHRARRWTGLGKACDGIARVGTTTQREAASLYLGLVLAEHGNWTEARARVSIFLKGETPEPFPLARAQAWRTLASCEQKLGRAAEEREALEGVLLADPIATPDVWLRLAGLQFGSAHGGYRLPEERWARGMSLLPMRTEELLPRWKQVGQGELASTSIDLEQVRQSIVARRVWSPPGDASLYLLWSLSLVHLEAGDAARAAIFAERLLEKLPEFVPGLDAALDAARALHKEKDVLALLVRRSALIGLDEKGRTILRSIPRRRISNPDRLALMRADPEGVGRSEIARWLLAHGRAGEALSILGEALEARADEDGRLLAARALLDLRQPARALELLSPLGRGVIATDEALDLFVAAALGTGDRAGLERTMILLARGREPAKARWLELADRLIRAGAVEAARPLLARLDREPALRGGDVLARLVAVSLATGDAPTLARALERAAAFDTRGEVELLAVLAAIREENEEGIAAALAALRRSAFAPTPRQEACLSALEGRTAAARVAIDAGVSTDPDEPLWRLAASAVEVRSPTAATPPDAGAIAGSSLEMPACLGPQASADAALFVQRPARALGLLLAVDSALGAGWAVREIESLPADLAPGGTAGTWTAWLAAVLARGRGDATAERAALAGLVERTPRMRPAWDRLEELATSPRIDPEVDPAVVLLRRARLTALGEGAGTAGERLLDRARLLLRAGDADGAHAALLAARAEDPPPLLAPSLQARIAAARGEWQKALLAWQQICLDSDPGSDLAAAGGFLDALEELALAGSAEPDLAARSKALETIGLHLQHDPRIALALARADLALDPRNPTLAVSRAYARLDRFQAAHANASLESLCTGACEAWIDFLLALDPARAEALLERERRLDPGAPAPWLLAGRVQAALGRSSRSRTDLDLLARILPGPGSAVERARVRLAGSPSHDEVEALAAEAAGALEGADRAAQLDLDLWHAQARYDLGPKGLSGALEKLEELESSRHISDAFRERDGLLRALALVARGDPADLARAEALLSEIEPLIADPYRRTVARACLGLTRAPTAVAQR